MNSYSHNYYHYAVKVSHDNGSTAPIDIGLDKLSGPDVLYGQDRGDSTPVGDLTIVSGVQDV